MFDPFQCGQVITVYKIKAVKHISHQMSIIQVSFMFWNKRDCLMYALLLLVKTESKEKKQNESMSAYRKYYNWWIMRFFQLVIVSSNSHSRIYFDTPLNNIFFLNQTWLKVIILLNLLSMFDRWSSLN